MRGGGCCVEMGKGTPPTGGPEERRGSWARLGMAPAQLGASGVDGARARTERRRRLEVGGDADRRARPASEREAVEAVEAGPKR